MELVADDHLGVDILDKAAGGSLIAVRTLIFQLPIKYIFCQIAFYNTVYIGFCDQPPSEGSGSLNPKEVAKSSGFQLDITTRRSQNTGLVVARP